MRFTYQSGAQPLVGYTIQRGIHRGGFGEVYFARSDGGKDVALKLLHEQDQDVEIRGVTQCLNLKHPNLVNIFDIKTDEHGDHWVVMEYVTGSSLEDILGSFPSGLPLPEVRDWLNGLVAGVTYLHDRGIVHRDLKPANVYRENGVVKIGDVGLSKRVGSDRRHQHTQSVGTVYYMAPEVARGQYGPEVDVYSLGVMLYELITGRLPFTGETTAEILMKHLTAQPDLTPIPKSLRSTLARALEKDPRQRTPSVRQLEQDFLRAYRSTEGYETIPDSAFLLPNSPGANGQQSKRPTQRVDIPVQRASYEPTVKPAGTASTPDVVSPRKRKRWPILRIVLIAALVSFSAIFSVKVARSEFDRVLHPVPPWSVHFGPHPFGLYRPAVQLIPRVGLVLVLIAAAYGVTRFLLWPLISSPQTTRPFAGTNAPTIGPSPRWPAGPTTYPAATQTASAPLLWYWNRRLPQLFQSLGLAGFVASLISAGIYLSLGLINRAGVMPSVEHAVLFTATSVVGTWLLLIANFVIVHSNWSKRQRWLARLATGAILGSCAYGLDQFLLVNTPPLAFTARSVFSSLGARPLADAGGDPTWLGYACFFAVWLGIRRWTRDMDPLRKKRYSIGVVAASVALAYATSMVLRFPQWNAMLLAGTITTTVQLASNWSPNPSAWKRR